MIRAARTVAVAWALALAMRHVTDVAQALIASAGSTERVVLACVVVAVWGATVVTAAACDRG